MTTSDNGPRHRLLEILMEQVRSCRYPSPTMMDRIEKAVADRGSAEEYVNTLIDLLEGERFPSPQLLDRVSGLLNALDRAAAAGTA
jgi:hypothetical protein